MSHKFTLPQEAKLHGALKPATDSAGRNGRWVSVRYAHKAYIVANIDNGAATGMPITVQQATDVAGTGAKAIATARIWANTDVAAGDTLVRQADAASYTTPAAVKEVNVVIEIDPSTLDQANGFAYIRVNTGASAVGNSSAAHYVLTPLRIPAEPPPSIIV